MRLPGARLTWLVEPAASSLLEGHPALDEVVVFRRSQATGPWSRAVRDVVGTLRSRPLDLALDFHGILKSALFARASRARRILGFDRSSSKEGGRFFYSETVDVGAEVWRPAQFLALAAAAAPPPPPEPPEPRIPVRPEEAEAIDRALADRGLGHRRLVVLHPGASAGAAWKLWPLDRYRLVGQRLAATGEVDVVVAWGPGEEALAAELSSGGTERLHRAPPTSLRELAHLLRRADLVIGPDTGPLHLAAAAGTRVLGIFGPSDPRRNRPLGDGHVLLGEGEPLRPRPWNRGLLRERMEAVTAHRVYDEAARMLELV